MVQRRLTQDAVCRSAERRSREGSEALPEAGRAEEPSLPASAGIPGGRPQVGDGARGGGAAPAGPGSRRCLIGWRRGAVCPCCARRARAGRSMLGVARTSCRFLAVTWVVLTVGEPLSSSL